MAKSILATGCGLILDNLTELASPGIHFLINAIIEISSSNLEFNKFENESFYKKIDEMTKNKNFMEYNYISNEKENEREEKKENFLKEIKAKIYMSKKNEPKNNELQAVNLQNKILLTADYTPSPVINKVKMLKPLADKHNIDWCLKNLYFNFRQITNYKPSKLIFEQLKTLISKYSIKTEVIRNLKLDPVHFLFIDDDQLTIESLKDKLIRLLKLYPEIKSLIESLNQTNLPNEMNDKSLVKNSFILDKNYNYVKKIDFDDILNKFFVEKKRSILIHGIAGSGKSTSASEFSRYFCKKNLHHHICFSLEMCKIKNQIIEQINEYTKTIDKNSTYLFVFDNVYFDDSFEAKYETIINSLPTNVFVLLTSVSSNETFLKKFDFCIEMELFNRDEARDYFKLALKNKNGDIESIMSKLSEENFIPLKLLNIISFLNDSEALSIEEAMQTIKLDNFDLSNYLFSELLKEESTKTILELLSFTNSKKLSIYFMKKILCHEFLMVKRFNDGKINQGIFKLKNFSILYQVYDSNDKTNYLNIHDSLKDELVKIMAKDETKMNEKLNKILKNIKKNLDSNTIFTLNDYSHILNIMRHANTDSAEYHTIFNKLKIFFRKSGENYFKEENYDDAIQYLHKYNELIELKKDDIDEYELFFVYDNLEKCFTQLNESEQARKYHDLLDELSITRENYESQNGNFDSIEDDPEILEMLRINSKQENELFANTLYNIASSYQAIGKYKDAIKLYEISIEIYLLIYGEKENIFIDLVYECIKECDIEGSYMKDVRENSNNPLNSKFMSYKEKNHSKACLIS
jgi:signal recognition particle GTPase